MVGLRWQGRILGAMGTHAPPPSVPPKNIFLKRRKMRKKVGLSMSDGCYMPSFLVVGCSIRASLTCLFDMLILPLPYLASPGSVLRPPLRPASRPLYPFIFRWIRPWMSVDSLSPPPPPPHFKTDLRPWL